MNITFLIGNGFDIGLGMRTKFSHYIPLYQVESLHKEENLVAFSDRLMTEGDNWSDFEKQLGVYTSEFSDETKRVFLNQLSDFKSGFLRYLKTQEDDLCFEDRKSIAEKMVTALKEFYSPEYVREESSSMISEQFRIHGNSHHIYNFLSFNYTDSLEKCLESIDDKVVARRNGSNNSTYVDKIGRVIHVHGYRAKEPIFGVDNTSQIASESLSKDANLCRYIVKPTLSRALRTGYASEAKTVIKNSTIICVYGMSLGETDKTWWEVLVNWLEGNGERQLVIYDYDENYSEEDTMKWLDKNDEIMLKLGVRDMSETKMREINRRVHIAVNHNIFQLDLAEKNRVVREKAAELLLNQAR